MLPSHHPESPLTSPRIVGTPARWRTHAGALGGLVGGVGTLSMSLAVLVGGIPFGVADAPWILAAAVGAALIPGLVGVAGGAAVGSVVPVILDRVRGRVPLPVLAVAAGVPGAVVGGTAGGVSAMVILLSCRLEVNPMGLLVGFGAVVGFVAAIAWWLPFTVATVLRRSWPVTSAVGLGVPALLAAAVAALVLLL